MTTYTLAIAPKDYQLTPVTNDETFEALSGAIQATSRTGNRFQLSMSWVRDRANYMALAAAMFQLDGKTHRLLVPMAKLGYSRRGVGGGTPLLHGAHTAGTNAITLRGLPGATTGVLQPGDFIQIVNQLSMVTSLLSSSGSPNTRGACTIWPELHKNYSDGAAINYATPGGLFILMTQGGYGMDHGGIGSYAVDMIQDVLQ